MMAAIYRTHTQYIMKTIEVLEQPKLPTFSLYLDDMGSYSSKAISWEDFLWHVNSARDHDGLKHVSLATVKRHGKRKA